jgi:hypothetical protein
VIVIDEIGRELEAAAARTIAERGVQLVATAHGRTLENLLLNPTLSDLIGGIESVTLSDEEARRRGTQKTVLERRAPPTFDVLVEIQERNRIAVHADVAASVDALLRGYPLQPEIRYRDEHGEIHIQKPEIQPAAAPTSSQGLRRSFPNGFKNGHEPDKEYEQKLTYSIPEEKLAQTEPAKNISLKQVAIYPYGVARNRMSRPPNVWEYRSIWCAICTRRKY